MYGVCAGELEMRPRRERGVLDDRAVVKEFLKLGRRFFSLAESEVGLPANINWIQESTLRELRLRECEIIRGRSFEKFQGLGRPAAAELDIGVDDWQPVVV